MTIFRCLIEVFVLTVRALVRTCTATATSGKSAYGRDMLSKGTLVRCVMFVLVCQYLTSSTRLITGAAFVHVNPLVGEAVQLLCSSRAIGGRSRRPLPSQHGYKCHQCQSPCGVSKRVMGPVFSATENVETGTAQLSDMDARVLNELLADPAFMKSLREQGLEGIDAISDTTAGIEGEGGEDGTEVMSKSPEAGSGSLAVVERGSRRKSEYESATMQVVEELQESVRGLVAKLTAAIESAGIYVSNRAQTDVKVIAAVVDYASKQAVAGTGKLLLAATGAASPAFQLVGINATDTQESLNVSLQLMSLGMVPDSLDTSPRMLTSLKDFDNDDKRLSAAYRRQRRLRSKPLPAKLLGALPSTLNKAADLAYEVEQEVKYERAGSRANKLLKPLGLSLPEARDTNLLLGGPDPSGGKVLEGSVAEDLSAALETVPNSKFYQDKIETPDDARERPISPRADSLDKRRERGPPMPPPPDPFGAWKRFWQTGPGREEEGDLPRARVVPNVGGAEPDSKLVAALVARPQLLANELSTCLEDGEQDLVLQARSTRAADAVLCSTELVMVSLKKNTAREYVLLDQVKSMAKTVLQQYVLAEMNEAVEAAEAHVVRLEQLATNVMELSAAVRAYIGAASERTARMINIKSRFQEAKTVADTAVARGGGNRNGVFRALKLLEEFDANRARSTSEAVFVNEWLSTVRRESSERALDDAGRVHEDAMVAAARLWEVSVSALPGPGEHASAVNRIANEVASVAEAVVAVSASVGETEAVVSIKASRMGGPDMAGFNSSGLSGVEDAANLIRNTGEKVELAEVDMMPYPASAGIPEQESATADNTPLEDAVGMKEERAQKAWSEEVVLENESTVAEAPFVETAMPVDIEAFEEFTAQVEAALDATVVSDVVASMLHERTTSRPLEREYAEVITGSPPQDVLTTSTSGEKSITIVVDESQSFVDTEAEVEDDISDPSRVGIKVLDVTALLIEKILFVGLPTVLSGGALVWERVDNVVNGAKGRRGWKLLKRFKKDWSGDEHGARD